MLFQHVKSRQFDGLVRYLFMPKITNIDTKQAFLPSLDSIVRNK